MRPVIGSELHDVHALHVRKLVHGAVRQALVQRHGQPRLGSLRRPHNGAQLLRVARQNDLHTQPASAPSPSAARTW